MGRLKDNKGFTLIEMLVSLVLVALLAATSMSGIRLSIGSQEIAEKKTEDFQRLRFIRERMTNSLRSLYPFFYKGDEEVNLTSLSGKEKYQPHLLAFEGKPDSIRFITFAEKLNSFKSNPLFHEARFFLGTDPGSGKSGLIMSERDISYDFEFHNPEANAGKASYILLASDVSFLKIRYYKVEKFDADEAPLDGGPTDQYQKGWVDRVVNLPASVAGSEAYKISLPRAIEVTIGFLTDNENNEPTIIKQPPIVINLNSGMIFQKIISDDNTPS